MIPKWPGDRDRTGWFDGCIELTSEMNCVRGLPECAGLFVDDVLGIYQFNKVCGGDESGQWQFLKARSRMEAASVVGTTEWGLSRR